MVCCYEFNQLIKYKLVGRETDGLYSAFIHKELGDEGSSFILFKCCPFCGKKLDEEVV